MRKKTGTKFSTASATVNTQRHLTIAILLRVSKGIKRSKWTSARVSERTRWTDEISLFGYEMSEFTRRTLCVRLPICAMNSDGVCRSLFLFISSLLFRLLHAVFVSSTNLPRMMTYKSAQIHSHAQTHTNTAREIQITIRTLSAIEIEWVFVCGCCRRRRRYVFFCRSSVWIIINRTLCKPTETT